jgi:hypothetical protein
MIQELATGCASISIFKFFSPSLSPIGGGFEKRDKSLFKSLALGMPFANS